MGQAGTLARRKTLKIGGGVCSPRTDIPPAHTPSIPGSGALITGATNAPENFFLPQPGRSCCPYHASWTWAQGFLELGVKDQRPRAPTFKLNKQPSGFPRPLRQGQSPALPAPLWLVAQESHTSSWSCPPSGRVIHSSGLGRKPWGDRP